MERDTNILKDYYENAVFVSYAQGGESERIVNELEQAFARQNIRILRDTKDNSYKGSIEAFEQRLAQGQYIVLVISDGYLRSPHCMYELVEIGKNRNIRNRIFPIVLVDAQIYKAVHLLDYVRYWDQQIAQLNQAIRQVDLLTNLDGISAELNKYARIRASIDHLTDLLRDMNALTPETHEANGFSTLIGAIMTAMAGNEIASASLDGVNTSQQASQNDSQQLPNPEISSASEQDTSEVAETSETDAWTGLEIHQEKERIMQEIRKLMSEFIPDFDDTFPLDVKENFVSEIRDENIFRLKKARALVFGESRVGKTTTINFLLSDNIFPTTGKLSCTKVLACGEHPGGLVFYDSPGLFDKAALDNVTRSVLGVPLLESKPISSISLLDLTPQHLEGPETYTDLAYEQYQDQISKEFYDSHKAQIVGKSFEVDKFSQWAKENIDFFVFVTSSKTNLREEVVEFLSTLAPMKVEQEEKIALFKVFNVHKDDDYKETIDHLKPNIKTRFDELSERSVEYGVDAPDQWFVVDSAEGHGLAPLIKAFANTLSPNVLRSLEQVVKREYAHLIYEKLEKLFMSYTARVASIVAVFPADYKTKEGEELLHAAIGSIAVVAEFLFQAHRKTLPESIGKDVVDRMIDALQFSKEGTPRYRIQTILVPQRSQAHQNDGFLSWLMGLFVRQEENLQTTKQVSFVDSVYTAIGGVEAIKLALAYGLTLKSLYSNTDESITSRDVKAMIAANLQTIEKNLTLESAIYTQIVLLHRKAGVRTDKDQKIELSNQIYAYIEKLAFMGLDDQK